MRLRGYDEETEEYSEDVAILTGKIADLTKTAKTPGGISLFTDETKQTYKSTYEILSDIAEIWDELSDKNRASLLEAVAGKRSAQTIASILENWSSATDSIEVMNASLGSSANEISVMMDSISYKLNIFKETWTSIAQTAISSDFMKSMVEQGTKILEIVEKDASVFQLLGKAVVALSEVFTSASSSIGAFGTALSLKAFNNAIKGKNLLFSGFIGEVNNFTNSLGQSEARISLLFGKINKSINFEAKLNPSKIFNVGALQKFNSELLKMSETGQTTWQVYKNNMTGMSLATKTAAHEISLLNKQLQAGTITQEQYDVSVNKIITDTTRLTTAQKVAGVATKVFGTILQTAFNVGVALIISKIVEAISNYVREQKELNEAAKESAKAIKEQEKELNELVKQYEEILDSENSEVEKIKELETWKEEIIDTYGLERTAIEKVNLEREKGIELIKEEIDATNRRARNVWLGENINETGKAKNVINTPYFGTDGSIDYKYAPSLSGNQLKQIVDENITKYFSKWDAVSGLLPYKYALDGGGYYIKFDGKNLNEVKTNMENLVSELQEKVQKGTINQAEKALLNATNASLKKVKATIDEYGDTYETYYKYTAENLFEDYIKNNDISDVTQETFNQWKQGLLDLGKGDRNLQEYLSNLIYSDETLSAYQNYYDELEKKDKEYVDNRITLQKYLKTQIENSITPNSKSYAQSVNDNIKYDSILNQLDNEDLDIAIKLKLDSESFDKGIGHVRYLINQYKVSLITDSEEISQSISEQISEFYKVNEEGFENINSNISLLNDALSKVNKGTFEANGTDMNKLLKAFPDYEQKLIEASNDTEEFKKVLNEIATHQADALIESLNKIKDTATNEADKQAVQSTIDILTNSIKLSTDATETESEAIKEAQTTIKSYTSGVETCNKAFKEQEKYGNIAADTVMELVDAGYANALVINKETGEVTLNKQAYEKLVKEKKENLKLDLEQQKSDLAKKFNDESAAINSLAEEMKTANAERRESIILEQQLHGKNMSDIESEMNALDAYIAGLDGVGSHSGEGTDTSSSNSGKPEEVTKFEEIQKAKKHQLAMNKITEEEYYSWLQSENERVFKNLEDYQDDYWKYQEEYYNWVQNKDKETFENKLQSAKDAITEAEKNNDFGLQKSLIQSEIDDTEERIKSLLEQGYKESDKDIKDLRKSIKELEKELVTVSSNEYTFKIKLIDEEIEDLTDEYSKTGDTSIFDKKIELYKSKITSANEEIQRLMSAGYTETSDEIIGLYENIEDYEKSIVSTWEEQTDLITDDISEKIKNIDDLISATGNTKLYNDKIDVYKEGTEKILERIEFFRNKGYSEDSKIIKSLKNQWTEYQKSITSTLKEQADAQIDAYKEVMDERKDNLNKQKDIQDELYDAEKKKLEEKKKALEDINDTIEKENTLKEKGQSIADAALNVQKNARMVYAGNGQYVQKARKEDIDTLEKSAEDYANELRQQEIDKLSKVIKTIDDAKSKYDTAIENQIKAIDNAVDEFERIMKKTYNTDSGVDWEYVNGVYNGKTDFKSGYNDAKKENDSDSAKLGVTKNNQSDIVNSLTSLSNILTKANAITDTFKMENFWNKLLTNPNNSKLLSSSPVLGSSKNLAGSTPTTINNSPTINTTINVSGGDKDIANTIATEVENKVVQAFTTFTNSYASKSLKLQHS